MSRRSSKFLKQRLQTAPSINRYFQSFGTSTSGQNQKYHEDNKRGNRGMEFDMHDIDECTSGTHKCHKDATCINKKSSYSCRCNAGKTGNGFICGEPAAFKDSPKTVRSKKGEAIRLDCSYYNSTKDVRFEWIKDYASLDTSKYRTRVSRVDDGSGVDITTHSLEFNINEVTYQGYYWCRIREGNVVDQVSENALVRLTDASATRLAMKINQAYSTQLNLTTSLEHTKLQGKIRDKIFNHVNQKISSSSRKRRSTHGDDQAVLLRNIRGDGSSAILLDAIVYYGNVTNEKRLQICSAMQNVTASTLSSSDLQVLSLQRNSYDCCYSNATGDPDIKGIIHWPTTVISGTSKIKCPATNTNENATRSCSSRDFSEEPIWQLPNTEKCMYIREATQKLDSLTKTVVNASNAVKIVKELEEVTNNQTNIKTYVDVSLAVDVVANIAESQSNNTGAFDGIVNVTNSLMGAEEGVVGAAQQRNNASTKLVKAIEKFAENIPLAENQTQQVFSKPNLAIGIADVSKEVESLETTGFVISGQIDKSKTSLDMKKEDNKTRTAKIADIVLPGPLFKAAKNRRGANKTGLRVTTFLYDNEKLFLSKETSGDNSSKKVNSKILAVSIKGLKLENLTEEQRVRSEFRELLNSTSEQTLNCVYWEEELREWSTRGCRSDGTNPENAKNHRCSCNHLTNFALLLDVTQKKSSTKPPPGVKVFLQFFTYIGCGLSIAGLFITLVTLLGFKSLRSKNPQKIMIGICSSLILALIAFLIGTQFTTRFNLDQGILTPISPTVCLVSSVLTHFFILLAFFWMGMQSYYLYLSCVKVMAVHVPNMIPKMAAIAIGCPIIIVGIVFGVDSKRLVSYTEQSSVSINRTDKILNESNVYVNIIDDTNRVCMINGLAFYFAYLLPIGLILLVNVIFLAFSLRGIFASSKKTKSKGMSLRRKWRMVAACTVLLGLTWIIGVFAIGPLKVPLQITFTIFNSLQGLFIFVFYCLCNSKVQKEWRRCMFSSSGELSSTSQSSKRTASSSATSRSIKRGSESKKSKKGKDSDLELRSRTFTNSLAALQKEFGNEDYKKESIFGRLQDKKGFYAFTKPGGQDEEFKGKTFIKVERNTSTSI